MNQPDILIAGIGNIFNGDDGFGVEVAHRLLQRNWPEGVRVVDFGVRSFDLAFALVDGYQFAILVDTLQRNEPPGTLYLFEPDLAELDGLSPGNLEGHGLHPAQVLKLANLYGTPPERILLVGCEPESIDFSEEGKMGLSLPVQTNLDEAVRLVESLVQELRQDVLTRDESN